jgi:regulatory protein
MSKSLAPLADRLWDAALVYLGRAESSVQSVRRMLARRVATWARQMDRPDDPAALAAIEAVIVRLQRQGAVDDTRFAAQKVLSLSRDGRSGRAIAAYLAQRGIGAEIVEQALASRADEAEFEPDFAAALRFAAKRRLGRFRTPDQRLSRRRQDLAALGRAGFSWDIARRLVDSDGDE